MALKRRSRRDTAPIGNPPVIGPRDVALFLLLTRYRYLDSRQLWRLLPAEVREKPQPHRQKRDKKSKLSSAEIAFKQRLQKLTSWGYLTRSLNGRLPKTMRYFGHEIYEIASEALLYLALHQIQEVDITGLAVGSTLQFPHALMICSSLASLEIGANETPGVRFITWQEILARAPREARFSKNPWLFPEVAISYDYPAGTQRERVRLKPDCPPFGFEYDTPNGKLFTFATIEAERSNKAWANNLEDTSWLKKALGYQELRRRGLLLSHFNLPNFFIIVTAPTRGHVETMKSLLMEITNNAGSDMYLFSRIPVYARHYETLPPMPELFTEPLQRAGRPDLCFSRLIEGVGQTSLNGHAPGV